MIVDLTTDARTITRAALEQMLRFQQARTGLDNVHPSQEFPNVLRGKLGEAAWAQLLGFGVDAILDDGPGRPDFTTRGWNLDAKTATPTAPSINVRAYYLDKPDLEKWQLLAARADTDRWTVQLIGSLRGHQLTKYPIQQPASGHSSAYLAIPLQDFDQTVINRHRQDRETP